MVALAVGAVAVVVIAVGFLSLGGIVTVMAVNQFYNDS